MAGIYSVMALGLNVQWGFTGLFNIGIAGFFALGAYTSALLTGPPPQGQFEDYAFGGDWAQTAGLALGIDLWFFFGIAAAMLVCAGVALVIGYVTLRLNEDYLAIATLGIAESVRLFFLNEKWAANGSRGLYNIPQFLEGLIAPGQVRLPVCGGGSGGFGGAVPGRSPGGPLTVGPGAAGDTGG